MLDFQPSEPPAAIEVVLAAWNGVCWLEQQLESLRCQTISERFTVRVRDDGSTDGTQALLDRWQQKYPDWLSWHAGTAQLGPRGSFSELALASKADYVFFCDQDDVWDWDKMAISLAEMRRQEAATPGIPLLVHTDLRVCNAELEILADSFWRHQALNPTKNALGRLLLQNVVTGCTTLVNRRLLDIAGPVPDAAIMHDWWLALVAAAFGRIIPLRRATISYRQHATNVCGTTERALSWSYLRRKLRQPKGGQTGYQTEMGRYFQQAEALYHRFDASAPGVYLTGPQRMLLRAFFSMPAQSWVLRRMYILRYGLWKQEWIRNAGWLLRA